MNRCPACGATYVNDARFCSQDGARLLPMPDAAAPQPSPESNLVGETLDGRYQILRKIGEGGMSSVYLARDLVSGERRAVKILSGALSSDTNAMERLRREAGLGMRLAHPNVCHIISLGETTDGLVYVVMPFIEGEILADRTNRLGCIPLDDAAPLVRDIAVGLNVAHQLDVVHRDLKPENVMLCKRAGGAEYAVVMDFGLAKEGAADPELRKLTATGIILGTPAFMSPEQLRGKPIDARSDVYALALVTYEMITGRLPFQGRTQQEIVIARLRSEPISLGEVNPELDAPAVERVLAKAMQRNPEDRYQTTIEFAEAFMAAVAERKHGQRPSRDDGSLDDQSGKGT